jgi:hypothetical protein
MIEDVQHNHDHLKSMLVDTAAGDVLIPLPDVAKGELSRANIRRSPPMAKPSATT